MSYIAAYHDRYKDKIIAWERTQDGRRVVREKPAPYYFYIPSGTGEYTSVTGVQLKKLVFDSKADFDEACLSHPVRFESDLNPLEKFMMDTYSKVPAPSLNIGLLDIEVDYDPNVGFPRPSNPYAPVNALTIYLSHLKSYFTLLVPPPGWVGPLPEEMVNDNYIIFQNERQLLDFFFELLEDVDLISGWNSQFFDLPYLGKRIELLYGQHALKKLEFERSPAPRWGEEERFKGAKEKEIILNLVSRVHIDYMQLFKKLNLQGRQSYSLAAISNEELDVPKLHYEGTLYELYRNDFIHFAKYNRHDVTCIVDLNEKFKYIELANNMVHEATVSFDAIFGSVRLIDTAIINFCHNKLNKIVFDRTHRPKQVVEGALVMTPRVGLHRWIGSCDINSLYPSTYRSLNLSPEKIVGQLLEYEEGWRAIYNARKNPDNDLYQSKQVTLRLEGTHGEDDMQLTARDMIELLEEKKFAISGYGTILDQGNGEGIIPAVLTYWFKDRKALQAKKKEFAKEAKSILEANGGNKQDPEYIAAIKQSEYYDMLQGVKKVLLNSQYGSTLNEFCRFHDPRLGASTTGSGRQITTFMIETVAASLIGENPPKIQKTVTVNKDGENENEYIIPCPEGLGPIYSDTDSCYFSMERLVNDSLEDAVACADAIVDHVNASFPSFMQEAFFCQPGFDSLIKANREVVAKSGIFRAKKKYMLYVLDMEGTRLDPTDDDKTLKTQGSDIKLSSTPESIRKMLKDVTMMILRGHKKAEIDEYILSFRRDLNGDKINILDYATVTSVKTLDEYLLKWERIEKPGHGRVNMPNNARSSINFNSFIQLIDEKNAQPIMSGQKIKIIWLKPNQYGFDSIAVPSEYDELPPWFTKHLEVDIKTTEAKLVDQKLKNIFDPIGWIVPTERTVLVGKLLAFD